MAGKRPYKAQKAEGDNGWEIVNTTTDQIVDAGLEEEQAKARAEAANEMYAAASEEESGGA